MAVSASWAKLSFGIRLPVVRFLAVLPTTVDDLNTGWLCCSQECFLKEGLRRIERKSLHEGHLSSDFMKTLLIGSFFCRNLCSLSFIDKFWSYYDSLSLTQIILCYLCLLWGIMSLKDLFCEYNLSFKNMFTSLLPSSFADNKSATRTSKAGNPDCRYRSALTQFKFRVF